MRIINADYSPTNSGTETINVGAVFTSSREFLLQASMYRFLRVKKIQITVYPTPNGGTAALLNPYKILALWTDDTNASDNNNFDDSAMVVIPTSVNAQIRTFLPINATLPTSMAPGSLQALNPKQWVVIDDILLTTTESITYYYPCQIRVKHPSNANFSIYVYVEFKGAKLPAATMLSVVAKEFRKIEQGQGTKEREEKGQEQQQPSPNEQ